MPTPELMAELDERLGDPHDPATALSYARCAQLDARDEFPAEACRLLDGLGLPAYYAPAAHGGALARYEDLLGIIRILARRDFTVALAHCKTYLGSVAVWMGGTAEQAAALGRRVTGGAVVSLALTESAHGSDLLAGELTATVDGDGYRLDGEKWLINNATRADLVCVLARTDPAGGPRGFSLFLVDKRALAASEFSCLPRVRTHGVRGADISGVAFHGAPVPGAALVGTLGGGLELAMKSLQVTRALVPGMSLGMADHALRLAVGFAFGHRMYERRLADLPHAARTLAEAYADLLTCEAVSLVTTRSIQALPGELSIGSAVVKYLVPTVIDQVVGRLGQVLGARALLTEAFEHGRFQKLERDHRIVGIFDGNTVVNLGALINQFPILARSYRRGRVDAAGLDAASTLDAALKALDRDRLSLLAREGSSVLAGLADSVARLNAMAAAGRAPGAVAALADDVLAVTERLHQQLAEHRPTPRDVPASAFDLAQRYTLCYAAAACVRLWLANQEAFVADPLWVDATWLEAALVRLLRRLDPAAVRDDGPALDRLAGPLADQYRDGSMFSLLPCRLSEKKT